MGVTLNVGAMKSQTNMPGCGNVRISGTAGGLAQ